MRTSSYKIYSFSQEAGKKTFEWEPGLVVRVVPISILSPLPGAMKIPNYRPGVVRWVLYIRK